MTESSHQTLQKFDPEQAIAGVYAWWREAGVDLDFAEESAPWLAPPEAEQKARKQEQIKQAKVERRPQEPANALERALSGSETPQIGGAPNSWPQDLAGFHKFWMEDASLARIGSGCRIAPRGGTDAELMILVAQPDESDHDRLLAGSQGTVLSSILRAMQLSEDQIYVASALPQRMAMPDWDGLSKQGISALAQHHVTLAAPKRLIVFGRNLAELLDDGSGTRNIADVPMMVVPSLENLARSAGRRQRFWNQWLDWTA